MAVILPSSSRKSPSTFAPRSRRISSRRRPASGLPASAQHNSAAIKPMPRHTAHGDSLRPPRSA
eukprot:7499496-Pyramimonas_sp.AAC.1